MSKRDGARSFLECGASAPLSIFLLFPSLNNKRRDTQSGAEAPHSKRLLCIVCLSLCIAPSGAFGQDDAPTVGMPARIPVVLPGPRLEARPLDNRQAPLVLRIVRVEPVEEGHRYEIEYTGLVPGRFDLGDYLHRK